MEQNRYRRTGSCIHLQREGHREESEPTFWKNTLPNNSPVSVLGQTLAPDLRVPQSCDSRKLCDQGLKENLRRAQLSPSDDHYCKYVYIRYYVNGHKYLGARHLSPLKITYGGANYVRGKSIATTSHSYRSFHFPDTSPTP
jgi:hypothetical protein